MICYSSRNLSYIVAALHLVWSVRKIYFITMDYFVEHHNEDPLHEVKETDAIIDMPIPAARLLWVLVFFSTLLMLRGVALNKPLGIATFLLTMGVFAITILFFAIWNIALGIFKESPAESIILEFINAISLIVIEFVLVNPIVLVFFKSAIRPQDTVTTQPKPHKTVRITITNCDHSDAV